MFPLAKLFHLAQLFLRFVSGRKEDMMIGSTEHVFPFEGDTTILPNSYRTQKIYFYFRASSLIFQVRPGSKAFCPPIGNYLDYYTKILEYSPYDIELIALDDASYSEIKQYSKVFSGYRVGSIFWLIEYLKNEFFDHDRSNKAGYNFSDGAYRMRFLYNDIKRLHFSDKVMKSYIETIRLLHGDELSIQADRCGETQTGSKIQVQWVMHQSLSFVPNEGIVALNTNLSHMTKILQSKALFIQSPSRLSHAATVAQEIGKPCFLGIPDIFLRLWHGDEVEYFSGRNSFIIRKRFYESE